MDASNSTEREYPYRPRWTLVVFSVGFFGLCAAVAAGRASTNDRGLIINHFIELSENSATIFYWALAVASLAFVTAMIVLGLQRLTRRQRIALTATSIIVPKSRWSAAEQVVPFARISALTLSEVHGQRFLRIEHVDGAFTLNASMLPSKAAFEEIAARVQAGVTRFREDHDRTRHRAKGARPPLEGW